MIYEFLLAALKLQRDAQRELDPERVKGLAGISLVNEYAMIHIGLHRQAGHSTALRKLADLALTDTDLKEYGTPVIIGHNHTQLTNQYCGHAVYTRHAINPGVIQRGFDSGLVLVDGTFDWSPSRFNEFKHDIGRVAQARMVKRKPFSLIMVQ